VSPKGKLRLDLLLVEQGLAETRSKARALIMAGEVVVNDQRVDKAGTLVPTGAALRLKTGVIPYVSRGGLKLERGLEAFKIAPAGLRCLDLGASTGGFTDCLLQRGAAEVVAVDVGYGQLHNRLRNDPRVVIMERTNARALTLDQLGGAPAQLVVADCSFISLTLLLPAAEACMAPGAGLLALVKPQFEAGPAQVGKGGVVRDEAVRAATVEKIGAAAAALGLEVVGHVPSPITGPAGNVEYLLYATKPWTSS